MQPQTHSCWCLPAGILTLTLAAAYLYRFPIICTAVPLALAVTFRKWWRSVSAAAVLAIAVTATYAKVTAQPLTATFLQQIAWWEVEVIGKNFVGVAKVPDAVSTLVQHEWAAGCIDFVGFVVSPLSIFTPVRAHLLHNAYSKRVCHEFDCNLIVLCWYTKTMFSLYMFSLYMLIGSAIASMASRRDESTCCLNPGLHNILPVLKRVQHVR